MKMVSSLPSGKVTIGFLSGLAALIIILLLNQYVLSGNPIDDTLGNFIVLFAFGLGSYFTKPSERDVSKVME